MTLAHGLAEPSLTGVTVRFGGVVAVNDVTLRFTRPITGIVGQNGAGKTTLLNVVAGLQSVKAGRVAFDDADVTRESAVRRFRRGISKTWQHPILPAALTVREHLATAGTNKVRTPLPVDEVAETLGLGRWLDEDTGGLPYGVRKLVDLGRALRSNPTLLLCDEPLSGLDEPQRDAMVGVLGDIAAGGTRLVVIEHDVARVRTLADELVALDFGRVIAAGAADEVLADPGVVEAFLGAGHDDTNDGGEPAGSAAADASARTTNRE